MDNTESDQEASTPSSTEDTPRHIDLQEFGSPTFEPLSLVRIERTPPEEGTEEAKRESPESETETPRRRIRFSTPISTLITGDPPLPPFTISKINSNELLYQRQYM